MIPKPAVQETIPGDFRLRPTSKVCLAARHDDEHARWIGEQLADRLELEDSSCDWLGDLDSSAAPIGSVVIVIDPGKTELGEEGYLLTVKADMITIYASDSRGAYYATESLVQLFDLSESDPRNNGDGRHLPCVRIKDRPRFVWRGFMLDSARHYQDLDLIKKWIDRMAALKLNRFHWHLCDDESWRLQIDKYPLLTEVSAWRVQDGKRYGGFYTKDQAREVVAYAKARGITVVPEIEMPGHCNAALHAYPYLSCKGDPINIGEDGWNMFTQVDGRLPFCVGKDQTLEFIKDILREVVEVFDTPYIHVGGDERPSGVWSECPHCQARMKQMGVPDEDALHVWFMSHIADFVRYDLGRQSIGWAEKLDVGIPENQIIQGWHPDQSAKAISEGRSIINSTHEWVYLDYPWTEEMQKRMPKWMPVLPLDKIYDFDPAREAGDPAASELVLGGEAPVWTEFIPNEAKLEAHVLPRLAALSEALWSPRESKNFDDFSRRLSRRDGKMKFKAVSSPIIFTGVTPKALTAVKKG